MFSDFVTNKDMREILEEAGFSSAVALEILQMTTVTAALEILQEEGVCIAARAPSPSPSLARLGVKP